MGKLKNCKGCGEQISKKAKSCPKCGEPVKKTQLLTWLVLILIVLWAVFKPSNSTMEKSEYTVTPSEMNATQKAEYIVEYAKATKLHKKKEESHKLEVAIKSIDNALNILRTRFNDKNYKGFTREQLNVKAIILESGRDEIEGNLKLYEKTKNETLNKKIKIYQHELKKVQIRVYPKLRDAMGPALSNVMWESDVEVHTIGKGFKTLDITGWMFASNKPKKKAMENLTPTLHKFRFKRVNFKWRKGQDEYTYFDISKEVKDDGDL